MYWTSRFAWYKEHFYVPIPQDDPAVENSSTVRYEAVSEITRSGILGIGMSMYLSEQAPSFYFSVVVGTSTFGPVSSDKVGIATGTGFSGGIGYEFRPSYSIESVFSYGSTIGNTTSTDNWTFGVLLVWAK